MPRFTKIALAATLAGLLLTAAIPAFANTADPRRSCTPRAPYMVGYNYTGRYGDPVGSIKTSGVIQHGDSVNNKSWILFIEWRAFRGFKVCKVLIYLKTGRAKRVKTGTTRGRWVYSFPVGKRAPWSRAQVWFRRK